MSKTTPLQLLLTTHPAFTVTSYSSWSHNMKNTGQVSHESAPMTSFESLTSSSSLDGAASVDDRITKNGYDDPFTEESDEELSEDGNGVSLETPISGHYPTFSRSTLRYSLRSTEYLIAGPRASDSPLELEPLPDLGIESMSDEKTIPRVMNGQKQTEVYIPHRGDDGFLKTASSSLSGSAIDEHSKQGSEPRSRPSCRPRHSPSIKLARFGVHGNHEEEKVDRTSPSSQPKRSPTPPQPFRSILKRESMAKFDTSARSDDSSLRQNPDRQTTFGPPTPTVSQQDEALNVARSNVDIAKHLTKEDVTYLEYFLQNPLEVNNRKGLRQLGDECPSCSFPITAESATWTEWWRRTMLSGFKSITKNPRRPSRLSAEKRMLVRSLRLSKDYEVLPRFESRMCSMTRQLFCSTCHNNDSTIIPFNIVSAWDFTELPVSKPCHRVITLLRDTPLISFRAIHPAVKKLVPELTTFRNLRKEFQIIRRLFDRDAAVELSSLSTFHPVNLQRKRPPPQPCAVAMSSYIRQLAALEESLVNRKYWLKNSDMFSLDDLQLIERYRQERGHFKFRCCAWTPIFLSVGRGKRVDAAKPAVAEAWKESRESTMSPRSGQDELSVADSTKFLTDFVEFVSHWEHHLVECQLCGSVLIEVKKLQRVPR